MTGAEPVLSGQARESFLRTLSAAVFLLFVQIYMLAPLIPSLAESLGESRQAVGILIPAFTLPYAVAGLICGAFSDRLGRRGIFFAALLGFPVTSLLMAVTGSLASLTLSRAFSGIADVGIVVMGLTLVGDVFAPAERGRALGWVFGAIAGGGALGSTGGALLAPWIGWRGLFALTGLMGFVPLARALPLWRPLADSRPARSPESFRLVLAGYARLLSTARARWTYLYITLNALFHGGVFTWLGAYFSDRYQLREAGIGLALIGYGIPGLLLGPRIGAVVDRHGRRWLIPLGLAVAAASAAILALRLPLLGAVLAVTLLSLSFDMTHPLLAGIATTLDVQRRGQAMGLNTFAIFLGFSLGSPLFGWLAAQDMGRALAFFAAGQFGLAVIAVGAFRSE